MADKQHAQERRAFTVSTVEPVTKKDGTTANLWTRVGGAWEHRDGQGFDVYIEGRRYVVRGKRD